MNSDLDPDDPRIEILARASRSIAVTPLDATQVVAVARTRRRRRHTAIGSALAVATLAAGISVATAGSDRDVKDTIESADTTQGSDHQSFPAPPEGMKWVGQNDLVVAVPSDWPVIDSPCRSGAAGEVVNGTAAAAVRCLAPSPTVGDAWVVIAALGSGPEPRTDRVCDSPSTGSCTGAEVFSDQGISIQVYTSGTDAPDQLNQILDSATVLPAGWTTVPFTFLSNARERVALLEQAGFLVDRVGGATSGSAAVSVTPEAGSVVEDGATITITITAESGPGANSDTPGNPVEPGSPRRPPSVEGNEATVAPDLRRLAEMFVSYAVGDSDTFPHAESVSMALGGQVVVSVDDIVAALSNRSIWKICPSEWDIYGASSCPVNLLGPINDAAANNDRLVYSSEYRDVVCAPARSGPLPAGRLVVLGPAQRQRSCSSDFALVLAADEQGHLQSIDLTLSAP